LQVSGPPSKSVTAIAHGVSVIPGAVVCSDSQTVELVANLYEQAWQDQLEKRMTRGQSSLIHGSPAEKPDPDDYGCILVPPGTKVMLESGNAVPVVTLQLPGGWARGVTFPNMLFVPPIALTPEQQKEAAERVATDTEAVPPTTQTNETPEGPVEPDTQTAAPIERREPTPTPAPSASSPIAGNPYRWVLQTNGDEALMGPEGKCATLSVLPAQDPNKMHLNFSDGSTKIFDVEQTNIAMQEATKYCATK